MSIGHLEELEVLEISRGEYADSFPAIITYLEALNEARLHSVDPEEWIEFLEESLLEDGTLSADCFLTWLGY